MLLALRQRSDLLLINLGYDGALEKNPLCRRAYTLRITARTVFLATESMAYRLQLAALNQNACI